MVPFLEDPSLLVVRGINRSTPICWVDLGGSPVLGRRVTIGEVRMQMKMSTCREIEVGIEVELGWL